MGKSQKIISKIRGARNKAYGKYIVPRKEQETVVNDQVFHYLFYPCKKSDTLAVGLQSYHPVGPRYGYISTLDGINVNRLYIKDDFLPPHGDFYLGRNGTYSTEENTTQLIHKFADQLHAKKIIIFGSSKGGYAALSVGLNIPESYIISCSPQYRMGTYLCDARKFYYAFENFSGHLPEVNVTEILNNHIQQKLQSTYQGQQIYLQYSTKEEGYHKYIEDLPHDLHRFGIPFHEDIQSYEIHNNLKYYFPDYLKKSVKEIIDKRGENNGQ